MKKLTGLCLVLSLLLLYGLTAAEIISLDGDDAKSPGSCPAAKSCAKTCPLAMQTPEKIAAADESSCPGHRAAAMRIDLIAEMHEIISPAWHKAYAQKDLEVIGAAFDNLQKILPRLNETALTFKSAERQDKYQQARDRFVRLVEKTAPAENRIAYDALPGLHENFEIMASAVLPLSYPEFEAFKGVLDDIINTYLPKGDYGAVKASAADLMAKNAALRQAEIPGDLKSVEDKVKTMIDTIGRACADADAACTSGNTDRIKKSVIELKNACARFEKDFI